jgi:hypothetical protein
LFIYREHSAIFRGKYRLHLQGRNQFPWFSTLKMEDMLSFETLVHIQTTWCHISWKASPPSSGSKSVRLIFYLEDGGDAFLRTFGSYTDYTALHSRRWKRSLLYLAYTKLVYTLLLLLAVVTYMIQYKPTAYWKRQITRSWSRST